MRHFVPVGLRPLGIHHCTPLHAMAGHIDHWGLCCRIHCSIQVRKRATFTKTQFWILIELDSKYFKVQPAHWKLFLKFSQDVNIHLSLIYSFSQQKNISRRNSSLLQPLYIYLVCFSNFCHHVRVISKKWITDDFREWTAFPETTEMKLMFHE